MLILLIDNKNISKKNIVSFLDIGKSLLLGNSLHLFCEIPEKSPAHLKKNSKIKTDYFFQNFVVFSV